VGPRTATATDTTTFDVAGLEIGTNNSNHVSPTDISLARTNIAIAAGVNNTRPGNCIALIFIVGTNTTGFNITKGIEYV
jgi:hypothetical protein